MKGKKMTGMIAAALSPVTKTESYDYALLKGYVDWLVAMGCDAIFAIGSTGGFPVFSEEERKTLAEGFVRAVDGRIPLCIQVGSDNEARTMALAKHAGAAGADCIAAVPPYYYKYNAECLAAYFGRIAAVNPDLPFYIYNIPMFTGSDITPPLLKRLRGEIPNLAGIKDTTQDYPRYVDYCDVMGPDFGTIMGSDAMCLAALQCGGAGGICAMAAHNPELMVKMFAAYHAGRLAEAQKLQFLSARMRTLMQSLPFMSSRIEILRLRGVMDSGYRHPFLPMNAQQNKHLADTLRALQDEFEFPLM